jgi:hypothetical protein
MAHVLVPLGSKPIIPGFGESAAAIDTRERRGQAAMGEGYAIVPSGEKGSHIKLTVVSRQPIILPANGEPLSPRVLSSVVTTLGRSSILDLCR